MAVTHLSSIRQDGKQYIRRASRGLSYGYHEGLAVADAFAERGKTQCGYVNRDFQFVVPLHYDFCGAFSDGLGAVVKYGDVGGYVDTSGKLVITLGKLREAHNFSDGLALVADDDRTYGYVNHSGNLVIPYQFQMADSFHDGLALVYARGARTQTYIDHSGKPLPLAMKFDSATPFSEGRATVFTASGAKLIDVKGNVIPTPPYSAVPQYLQIGERARTFLTFHNGLVNVMIPPGDGREAGSVLMDRNGKIVTPAKKRFEVISVDAWFAENNDGTTELLNKDGKPLQMPSPDCKPIYNERDSITGEEIDRHGLVVCPVTPLTPDERRNPDALRERNRPLYYFSTRGWRSATFTIH